MNFKQSNIYKLTYSGYHERINIITASLHPKFVKKLSYKIISCQNFDTIKIDITKLNCCRLVLQA